ncbi:hypothetical protein WEU32_06815 [Brevundimonas sp. BH3]|uniref:hypothetical protein n=1 Tax=Brevundimonas sp. BH3 TaxID=3133089 RepID=UPI0032462321
MSYEQACEYITDRIGARHEIEMHNADWSLFLEEVGDKAEYVGSEVLDWLGY